MSGEVEGGGGRRRRRSRSGRHHHKRRREREDGRSRAEVSERRPPFEEYWSSPPQGWHGSAGGVLPPGYPPRPGHPGPPHPPGYMLRPAWPLHPGHPGHPGHPPPEAPRYDPYAYRGNEVPPPPGMDLGKGRKGKGKFDDGEGRVSDGLILSNVPAEVNTLDALNRHFRHFGEVLKITSQVNEGKAYVQFASKASAEAAASVPVLDRPEITVAWLLRPKGKGSGKGKSDGRPAENRILCTDPEEQRKIEDMKIKREEVASRKTALLANLTNQIKAIMAKISDASVSEAKRETLRTLLLGLKEKLDSLSGPKQDTRMLGPPRSKQLDLRTRLLKFQLTEETSLEALREELRKLAGDQVADLRLEDGHFAVAQFKDRLVAEKVWNQKTELSCPVEWYEAVREARDEEVQEALTADGEGFPAQDFTSEAYAEAPHGEEEMAAPMAAPEESAEPFTDTGLGPETADAPRDANAPSAADTPHATDAPSAADAPRAADVPSAGDPPSASAGDAPSNVTAAIAEENQPETTGVTKDPGAVTTVTGDAATEAVDHGADWGDVTADTSVEAQGEEHTDCRMDVTASLPVLLGIICWALTFYFAPMVFGLPIVIADISLGPYLPSEKRKEEGAAKSCCKLRRTPARFAEEGENLQCVKVKSHGNHNLLRGQRATIYFRGTGDPRLDTKRFDFKVEGLTHHELLLLNLDGTPVSINHDSSTGHLQVKYQHAMLRMGMFGLPFIVWTLLPIGAYAALLAYLNSSAVKFLPSTSSLHVAIGCLVSVIVHSFRYKNLARTRLKKDIRHFIQRLKQKNPNPTRCGRGPSRAITAGQLKEFDYYFHGYHGSHRTMYYVCHNIILQLTHPFKLSYAELAGPSLVTWFVSHYWGTSFRHFVDTVSKHSEENPFPGRKPSQQPYWICSFSNNQWAVEEEVGKNWDESSFYLAMRSDACKGTVMVFDEDALPLTRSWCLFELLQTHHFKHTREDFAGLMLSSSNGVMNRGNGSFDLAIKVSHKLATLDLRDANASKESDKLMIEELVRRQAGFKNVRTFLTNAVEEVLLATRSRFQDKMTELQSSLALTQSESPTRKKVPEPMPSQVMDPDKEKRPALLGSFRKAYTTSLKSLERVLKRSGSSGSNDKLTLKPDLENGMIPEEDSPDKDQDITDEVQEEEQPSPRDL